MLCCKTAEEYVINTEKIYDQTETEWLDINHIKAETSIVIRIYMCGSEGPQTLSLVLQDEAPQMRFFLLNVTIFKNNYISGDSNKQTLFEKKLKWIALVSEDS